MGNIRISVVVVALLTGCAAPTPGGSAHASPSTEGPASAGPSKAAADAPFETIECPGDAVRGIALPVTCGYLMVAENRKAAAARQIRLLVVRVRPEGETSPDPVIALGFDFPWTTNFPGVAGLATRVHREVIMLASRGDGRSDPSLVCTELEDTDPALGTNDPSSVVDLMSRDAFMAAVQACHDRLVSDGVDLSAYNLIESAADVEDLRVALGIDEYNLTTSGTSSRVAFEVLRRHSGHLRSVIFDTPSAPHVDMFTEAIVGTRASLAALSAACAVDVECAAAYPDPLEALAKAMARLAANPRHATGSGHDLLLDDVAILRWMRTHLAGDGFAKVLAAIRQFAHGPNASWANAAANDFGSWPILSHGYAEGAPWDVSPGSFNGDFSHGLQYSIACHDQLPYLDRDALIQATEEEPWYRKAYVDSPFPEICELWDVGTGDRSVMEPVVSSVPTLLLVGHFDPFGVPDLVREAAQSLDTSWVIEFPGHSHNVLGYGQGCARTIRNAWIDAPTSAPDTSCLPGIPPVRFQLP
jgi:pimeloyl-ACP methyl ester carboxylesterase